MKAFQEQLAFMLSMDDRMKHLRVNAGIVHALPGMTPEQAAKALQEPGPEEAAAKYRHVGMWNVHKRLQYSFGEAYGLSIESEPDIGTTVTIRLPGPDSQK